MKPTSANKPTKQLQSIFFKPKIQEKIPTICKILLLTSESSTVKANFIKTLLGQKPVTTELITFSNKDILFKIWDMDGHESNKTISNVYFDNTNIILFMAQDLNNLKGLIDRCDNDLKNHSEIKLCFIRAENMQDELALNNYLIQSDIQIVDFTKPSSTELLQNELLKVYLHKKTENYLSPQDIL